jgi:hypothetical protein
MKSNDNSKYDAASRLVYDKRHLFAGVSAAVAIADTIRELGEVPAGTLYAALMTRMSLETFEQFIAILVKADLVKRDGSHLLRWIGPEIKKVPAGHDPANNNCPINADPRNESCACGGER